MSFSISKQITPIKFFPELSGMRVEGVAEKLQLRYTAESVVSLIGDMCTIRYSISTDGALEPGYGEFEFVYSGAGNPLDEAEIALKAALES